MSGAKPRSKYNAPLEVSDRYQRGGRRWSFYIPKPKEEDPKSVIRFRNVIVDEGGVYSYPPSLNFSCDCPDYQRYTTAAPVDTDEPDWDGSLGTPRVFPVDNYRGYLSRYNRYMRGYNLISQVEFVGIESTSPAIRYHYRIPTDRAEKRSRDWTDSDAGIYPEFCKHIWAVVIFRGDEHEVPLDVP